MAKMSESILLDQVLVEHGLSNNFWMKGCALLVRSDHGMIKM